MAYSQKYFSHFNDEFIDLFSRSLVMSSELVYRLDFPWVVDLNNYHKSRT